MVAFGTGFTQVAGVIKASAPSLCLASLGLRSLKMDRHAGSVPQARGDTGRALARSGVWCPECCLDQGFTEMVGQPHNLLNVNGGGKPALHMSGHGRQVQAMNVAHEQEPAARLVWSARGEQRKYWDPTVF